MLTIHVEFDAFEALSSGMQKKNNLPQNFINFNVFSFEVYVRYMDNSRPFILISNSSQSFNNYRLT